MDQMKMKGICWVVFHIVGLYKGGEVSQTTKSICMINTFTESQNHRITESQN